MKKSMMKGMTVLVASMAFASCSHESVYDPNYAEKEREFKTELAKSDYRANFEKKYGKIAPNQSWDFTNCNSAQARTRATQSGGTVQSERKDEAYNFFGYCAIDDKAMHDLISSSSSNYSVKVDNVDYQVKGIARDIDFNPFFQAKLTLSFARIDKCNTTTYRYYHLFFNWGDGQSMEMVPNTKVIGRSSGDYWYDGKNNSTTLSRSSRLTNTLAGVGTGNWYAYYTVNSGNGTAYHNTNPVKKVREFVVDDGKNPVRVYWGFDCDGAENGLVDLICLVRDYSTPDPIVKRYMIEDLGTTDDFDFNDIVVDFEDDQLGHQKAYIRAMGGTLDFSLNVAGQSVWTKSVNGPALTPAVNIGDMVNTNPVDYKKVIATVDVSGWNPAANNISVTVVYKDATSQTGSSVYTIPFPEVGQVPMMFATDPIVPWMLERKNFPEWWLNNVEVEDNVE
jgi:hypothetical protein